jgi:hypothetical protein
VVGRIGLGFPNNQVATDDHVEGLPVNAIFVFGLQRVQQKVGSASVSLAPGSPQVAATTARLIR